LAILLGPVSADRLDESSRGRLLIDYYLDACLTCNRKKTQRLYREEKLAVRRRHNRRRAIGARAPAPVLALPNQRWSLDFVHDQMASGRRFRVLNIVDDVTRECLRAVPDTSISGHKQNPRRINDGLAN
jgi:hypothetical protein